MDFGKSDQNILNIKLAEITIRKAGARHIIGYYYDLANYK